MRLGSGSEVYPEDTHTDCQETGNMQNYDLQQRCSSHHHVRSISTADAKFPAACEKKKRCNDDRDETRSSSQRQSLTTSGHTLQKNLKKTNSYEVLALPPKNSFKTLKSAADTVGENVVCQPTLDVASHLWGFKLFCFTKRKRWRDVSFFNFPYLCDQPTCYTLLNMFY